jgi:3-phosphoshikimate 1-carboxyvinyltransferase
VRLAFGRIDRMALPDLIEIQPISAPVQVAITIPGSKSITNRAMILAALGSGPTELRHALWSEDTQVMSECLKALGFSLEIQPDLTEPGNRHIRVVGLGGSVPPGGTAEKPLDLFVANAGTAARFLAAMVCLGSGYYRLRGIPRMHERPQGALFDSLRQLGYEVQSPNNKLPVIIRGAGPRPAECTVSIEESSQFASALLLSASAGRWTVKVVGENSEESPYVVMTQRLIEAFPKRGGMFQIEPDASSASYIWGANWLLESSQISVADWMRDSLQIDAQFPSVLRQFPARVSRTDDLGDSIMTAIVLAPFADAPKEFTGLGRLRVQECERVQALRTELTKCGSKVEEIGDTLRVFPSQLHGATIETYNDHRVAMCFGTLALKVPGIKIENPGCVRKTFPNFFQKLAAAPPAGLGARILDASNSRLLKMEQLAAE